VASSLQEPVTFTDRMRVRFKGVLDAFGGFFNRLGIHPNTMTLLGLIGNTLAAIWLAQGRLLEGGLLVVFSGAFDALDGTMARLRGHPTPWGAFVDSVTDRYSELVIFFGLLMFYTSRGDRMGVFLVYLAAAGSVLVSYVRARAASLGWEVKVGLLTRFERYLVLAPTLVLGIPLVGVGIVAVGANLTALQRIWWTRRQALAAKEW